MKRSIVIYKIENKVNKKCYVGFTTNFKSRIGRHLNELRKNKHHSFKLQASYNKHGESSFTFEVLEDSIPTIEEAFVKEIEYISKYDSFNKGYNMTNGGEGVHGHFGNKHWNAVKIYQYDLQGILLNEFNTIHDASKLLYEVDNLKFWKDRDTILSKSGFFLSKKKKLPQELCSVHRYGLDGHYIDSFSNKNYAAKCIDGNEQNLTRSIKIKGTYKGYQWRTEYLDKLEPIEIHSKETTRKVQGKKVIQYDLQTGETIKEYEVLSDAIREHGCSIASCVRGITKKSYGYGWKYKEKL